jgi:hypothetical protein
VTERNRRAYELVWLQRMRAGTNPLRASALEVRAGPGRAVSSFFVLSMRGHQPTQGLVAWSSSIVCALSLYNIVRCPPVSLALNLLSHRRFERRGADRLSESGFTL